MKEKEEIEFGVNEIEEFVQHRVWRYLVQAAVSRVDEKMVANNSIDPFKDPTAICRNQGFIEGLGYIVDLPSILKEDTEYERNKKKEEEKKDAT